MTQLLKRVGIWLLEAGIAGAPMVPLFIYVTSFIQHEGSFAYVLPFVLFYAFNKTGEYFLGIFGTPKNIARIAEGACVVTIAGAVLSLFGAVSLVFLDVGASLVGVGTSVFSPMWKVIRADLRNKGEWPYGKTELVGFLLMVIFSAVILMTQGHLEEVIIASYVVIEIVSLVMIRLLDRPDSSPLFDTSTRDVKRAIPGLALLVIVFFVRLFKQTANAADVLVLFVLVTVVMVVVLARGALKSRSTYEFRAVFYTECMIFVLLYDVFWFIGQGNIPGVLVVNLTQFLAQFLGLAFGAKVLGALPKRLRISEALVLLSCLGLLLFALPWFATNVAAVFVVALAAALGGARVGALYRKHNTWSPLHYTIMSQKVGGLGVVAGQAVLVGVLALVSFAMLGNGDTLMAAYALRAGGAGLSSPYMATKLICIAIFLLQGAGVLLLTKKKSGTVLFDKAS